MGTWAGSGFQIALDELSLKDLSIKTGLTTSKSENFKISTFNNVINIEGVKDNVSFFDIAGRKIQSVSVTGTFNSNKLNSGLYIVNVDGISTKVSVK